jgi:hypothetical protein
MLAKGLLSSIFISTLISKMTDSKAGRSDSLSAEADPRGGGDPPPPLKFMYIVF